MVPCISTAGQVPSVTSTNRHSHAVVDLLTAPSDPAVNGVFPASITAAGVYYAWPASARTASPSWLLSCRMGFWTTYVSFADLSSSWMDRIDAWLFSPLPSTAMIPAPASSCGPHSSSTAAILAASKPTHLTRCIPTRLQFSAIPPYSNTVVTAFQARWGLQIHATLIPVSSYYHPRAL